MIVVNEPLLNGKEKRYLEKCIDLGWISSEGPSVKRFGEAYSSVIGTKFSVVASSRTANIEVAVYTTRAYTNDEIIMPSFTIGSCAIACLWLGELLMLVDIGSDT